jgi:hypothetical protein
MSDTPTIIPSDADIFAQSQAQAAANVSSQAQAQAAPGYQPPHGPVPYPPVSVATLTPMERAVLELTNSNQATQNILQNMTQILGQLSLGSTTTAAPEVQPTPPSLSVKKVSVANPQHFDGDPRNFETFMTSVDIVFMADPHTYSSDTTKIFYVLSYMTKKFAAQWSQCMVHH